MVIDVDYLVRVHEVITIDGCKCWVTLYKISLNGTSVVTFGLHLDLNNYPEFFHYTSPYFLLELCHPYLLFSTTTNNVATSTILPFCCADELWRLGSMYICPRLFVRYD